MAVNTYKIVFDNLREGVLFFDKKANLTDINKKALNVLGFKKTEVIGKNVIWLARKVKTDVSSVSKAFKNLFNGINLADSEWHIINNKGKKIVLRAMSQPFFEKGEIKGTTAIIQDITNYKILEKEKFEAVERFKTYYETIIDPVIISDLKGITKEVNPAFVKITGYSKQEVVGKMPNILTRSDYIKVLTLIKEILKKGYVENIELTLISKNKTKIPVLATATLLEKTDEIIVILKKISLIKKREFVLKEEASFANNNPAPVMKVDYEGKVLLANPAALRICDNELVGKSFFKCFNVNKKVLNKELEYNEFEWNSTSNNFLFKVRNIKQKKEFYVYGADISQKTFLDIKLKESEEKYKLLVEASEDCIKLVDTKGKIKYINQAGMKEHGLKNLNQALKWDFLTSVKNKEEVLKTFNQALKGNKTQCIMNHNKNSDRDFCLELFIPIKDENKKVVELLVIGRDVSEQKKIELKLEQTKKDLEGKINELERFNKRAVGRELKMIELKKKIKELEKKCK